MTTETQGAPQGDAATTTTPQTVTEADKSQVKAEDTKTPDPAAEGENKDGTSTTDESVEEEKRNKRATRSFQRRMNELTAARREAEAKAEAADARARELEAKLNRPAQSDDLKPPRLEDFRNYEEFETAREAFVAERTRRQTRQELEDARKADEAKASRNAEQTRIREARERFDKAADSIADDYEGFDDFIEELNGGATPLRDLNGQALEQIFENDDPKIGAALAFYLHNRPAEVKRIAQLRPARQVAELARLEASLPKPKSQTTKAPAPPRTVGGRGGPDGKDPEKMTTDEMRNLLGLRKIVNV